MIRRCVAELIGTFAIVFFGCGAIAVVGPAGGLIGLLTVNIVFGLTVTAVVYALGHISSAHFNPAVSIGFAAEGRFPWRDVPYYLTAQAFGAILASALHLLLLPAASRSADFGATLPSVAPGPAIALETVLTFFLMLVIFFVAKRRVIVGFTIGAAVTIGGIFGGPLTGASMNPARSLGPAIFDGPHAQAVLWIYVLGPLAGALLAAITYMFLAQPHEVLSDTSGDLLPDREEAEGASSPGQ